jgi:pantoate--beta-alanine ligase
MVADLLLPLDIVGVPTVREADGLAMSSRNRFLNPDERAVAPALYRVLRSVAGDLAGGAVAEPVLASAREALTAAGFAVDYLALVDGPTLAPVETVGTGSRLIATARLGPVRLLDNVAIG